ncbi:MAG: hypothetical protein HQL06_00065 [Nitrospirae bacterium]|nr:hypothetical protein [Nitrospirota bacterium]
MSRKAERRKQRRRDVRLIAEETDKFVIADVTPQMKEALTMVSKSNLTPECLESLVAMSERNAEFLDAIEKLGPEGMLVMCQLAKDDNYVLTTKITLLEILNRLGRKDFIHRILHKLGAVIQAILNLKELLTY